jgi:hypothetical protein
MRSTTNRPVLFGGSFRLQQQTSLDDLFDDRLFLGDAPLSFATGYSEPSGQEKHWRLAFLQFIQALR